MIITKQKIAKIKMQLNSLLKNKKHVKLASSQFTRSIKHYAEDNQLNPLARAYLYNLGDIFGDYYFLKRTQRGEMKITNKSFSLIAIFQLCAPYSYLQEELNGRYFLELDELYSFEKGAGKEFIFNLIEVSKKLRIPIVVWIEIGSEHLFPYYQQFGFTLGKKRGVSNEYIMIKL